MQKYNPDRVRIIRYLPGRIKYELSCFEEKRAFIWRREGSGGRANIKTASSGCAIKCEQVFAECRQRERSQPAKITMMTPIFVTSLLLFALTCPCTDCRAQIDYAHCQSNSECGPDHCCTIGPIRYSVPQCRSFQEEGDICRPGSVSTLNVTVGYPNGAEIALKDVHYILCPCAVGLSCDPKEGVCKDIGEKRHTNRLSSENNKQND